MPLLIVLIALCLTGGEKTWIVMLKLLIVIWLFMMAMRVVLWAGLLLLLLLATIAITRTVSVK